jgi:hypothetical protein
VGSLKEFLASQAERLKAQKPEVERRREEWVAAVERLNDQIKGWLKQADSDGILNFEDRTISIREEGIGTYDVSGLSIGIGPWEVRVEPIARYVAGPTSATGVVHVSRASGRVDLTDGLRRYMIFRGEKEPEDRWNLIEQDGFRLQPFDQKTFEAAFQSLLE